MREERRHDKTVASHEYNNSTMPFEQPATDHRRWLLMRNIVSVGYVYRESVFAAAFFINFSKVIESELRSYGSSSIYRSRGPAPLY